MPVCRQESISEAAVVPEQANEVHMVEVNKLASRRNDDK